MSATDHLVVSTQVSLNDRLFLVTTFRLSGTLPHNMLPGAVHDMKRGSGQYPAAQNKRHDKDELEQLFHGTTSMQVEAHGLGQHAPGASWNIKSISLSEADIPSIINR